MWSLVVPWVRDINTPGCCKTTDMHTNLRLQHGLGLGTMDTNVAPRGDADHRGLLRRSIPENDLFFSLVFLSWLRTKVIMRLGARSGTEGECKLQAAAHHPVGSSDQ